MADRLEVLERFTETCSLLRYTLPADTIEALQHEGSRYSPEFEVGGIVWRLHFQHRPDAATNEMYLAVHLQCLSPSGAYAHFRLTVCNADPAASKAKTFHCHFKKTGSAWGLHQFIPLDRLLNSEFGFLEEAMEAGRMGARPTVVRRMVLDVVINVLEASAEGAYSLGTLPQSSKTFGTRGAQQQQQRMQSQQQQQQQGNGSVAPSHHHNSQQQQQILGPNGNDFRSVSNPYNVNPYGQQQQQQQQGRGGPYYNGSQPQQQYGNNNGGGVLSSYGGGPRDASATPSHALSGAGGGGMPNITAIDPLSPQHVKAPLMYPFEHLEVLCDMWFDVNGTRVKAHRCIIAARMGVLLPAEIMPLQEGVTVAISDSVDVFLPFLRYVYTEDYPEQGVLRPESLLDLYLLAARCEFYDLCGVCLKYVRPLLNADNILPIVLTKFSVGDEVLNALYLRILLDNYDTLIQDKMFEEMPGHLFRRLSLILREKERLPAVNIPQTRNTLGRQLAALADTGEYADYEIRIGHDAYLPAHRFILASRSVAYSLAFGPKGGREPVFYSDVAETVTFSHGGWQKFLAALYRRTLGESVKDLSAENIALIFKMHALMTLDGQLKRECELAVNATNALRVLIYAVKHSADELRDRAMAYVSSNFHTLVRNDPQAWDLIGELPQPAVVLLLRTITEAQGVRQ